MKKRNTLEQLSKWPRLQVLGQCSAVLLGEPKRLAVGTLKGTSKWLPLHQGWVCVEICADFAWGWNNGNEDRILTQLTTLTSTICLPDQPILSGPGRKRLWPWRVLVQEGGLPCTSQYVSCFHSLWRGSSSGNRDPLSKSLLSTGRSDTFTINCSGFDQHGADPAAFQAVFDRKAFRPIINFSISTHVNISFTLSAILEVVRPGPHFPRLLIGYKNVHSALFRFSGKQWYPKWISYK